MIKAFRPEHCVCVVSFSYFVKGVGTKFEFLASWDVSTSAEAKKRNSRQSLRCDCLTAKLLEADRDCAALFFDDSACCWLPLTSRLPAAAPPICSR